LKCKGYGFVDFHSPEEALNALRELKKLDKDVQLAKQREQDPTNLYFANLPACVDERLLTEMLQKKFGANVNSTRIMRERNGDSKCVGFARIEENKVCEQIIQDLNNKPFPNMSEYNGPDFNKFLLVKLADSGGNSGSPTSVSQKSRGHHVNHHSQSHNLTFGSSSSSTNGVTPHNHNNIVKSETTSNSTSANCSILSSSSSTTTNGPHNSSISAASCTPNMQQHYHQSYANYNGFPIQVVDTPHLISHPNHLVHRNIMPTSPYHPYNGPLQIVPPQFYFIPPQLTPQHHLHMQQAQQSQQHQQPETAQRASGAPNGSLTPSAQIYPTMQNIQQQFSGLSLGVPPVALTQSAQKHQAQVFQFIFKKTLHEKTNHQLTLIE
jgi:RNA recognition motif-containing protein